MDQQEDNDDDVDAQKLTLITPGGSKFFKIWSSGRYNVLTSDSLPPLSSIEFPSSFFVLLTLTFIFPPINSSVAVGVTTMSLMALFLIGSRGDKLTIDVHWP